MADDIIVWWVADERFDVMPNASNTAPVVAAIGGIDTTGERAVIAVQGPDARRRLASVSPEAAAVGRFRVAPFLWEGFTVRGRRHRVHRRGRRGVRRAGAGGTAVLGGGPLGRRRAGRARCPRHVAPGGRAAAARARAGAGDHPAAGRARAGWSAGTRERSGAGQHSSGNGPRARAACFEGCWPTGANRPGRASRCWPTAGWWARSPAGTSRPCASGASPWPWWTRRPGWPTATR